MKTTPKRTVREKVERLVLKRKHYFKKMARDWCSKYPILQEQLGVEEVQSVLLETIHENYSNFDSTKGALKGFLVARCNHKLLSLVRKLLRRKNLLKPIVIELDSMEARNANPDSEYQWLVELNSMLSPDAQRIVNMVLWPNRKAEKMFYNCGNTPRSVRGLLRTYLVSEYVGWTARQVSAAYENIENALCVLYPTSSNRKDN